MVHYQVFHPDHEVIGLNIISFQTAVGGQDLYPYYAKHDLIEVDPSIWYPLQRLLDVFNDLADRGGAMFDFVSLGMKSTENLILPPEVQSLSLVQLFQLSDTIYRMNNRGTNIGYTVCEVISDHHVMMVRHTPHPDDLWYGIGYGFARRFLPPGTHIVSYYDEDTLRRDEGGTDTKIHITWE